MAGLPGKLVGGYWPKYKTQDLSDIPLTYNFVYLFQAGPLAADSPTYPTGSGTVVLVGEGGDHRTNAYYLAQVQALRTAGVKVMLTIGGAGAYVDLSTTTKRNACLASIQSIYTAVGGFDGLDFNLETVEPPGLAVYPAAMVYIAQQLKIAYGSDFAISIPCSGHVTATYIQHDKDIIAALLAANCLDFVAPQVYDGFGTMTESQKITTVRTVLNFWAPYVGNDWSKMGIGFRTVGTTNEAMAVGSSYVAYDTLSNEHPEIRGAFHFDTNDDEGQAFAWVNRLAPRIAQGVSAVSDIPPIKLLDTFAVLLDSQGRWDFSGSATVTGGNLSLDPTHYGDVQNSVTSKASFDLTTNYAIMKFAAPDLPAPTTPDNEASFSFSLVDPLDPANRYVSARIFSNASSYSGGHLQPNALEVVYRNGSADTQHGTFNLGYDGASPWWKFYVDFGYLFLATASDNGGNPGTWTIRWLGALSDIPSLIGTKIQLLVNGAGTPVLVDSVGILPPVVVPVDYTDADALAQFHQSGSTVRFRYEHLDRANTSLGWLDDVVSGGSISYNYYAQIKRTCRLTLLDPESSGFNYIDDRVRVWIGVQMPNGTWRDRACGVFLLSSPTRHYDHGLITRACDGYDQAQVLVDDKVTSTYVIAAGAVYTDEIAGLLTAVPDVNITDSERTLPVDRSWDPGTTKMAIVADLLQAINYGSLWFDGFGTGQVIPYIEPDAADPDLAYVTDDESVIQPTVDQTRDIFSVPNTIIFTCGAPDRPLLYSKFVNSDPSSPVSTARRGRKITLFDSSKDVATQAELDALVKQAAIDAANVYEHISLPTMLVPFHEDRTVVALTHTGLGISASYTEAAWSMALQAGGTMTHDLRHVVNIDASLLGDPTGETS